MKQLCAITLDWTFNNVKPSDWYFVLNQDRIKMKTNHVYHRTIFAIVLSVEPVTVHTI